MNIKLLYIIISNYFLYMNLKIYKKRPQQIKN